jgi:hypothetical protein
MSLANRGDISGQPLMERVHLSTDNFFKRGADKKKKGTFRNERGHES